MKKMLFLWLLLQPMALLAWQGDVSKFMYFDDVLTLDAPAMGDTAYLSTTTDVAVNAWWNVTVCLQYVPSSSNLARIYLMADTTCLKAPVEGYFVQVGGIKRTVSLYRQDGDKVSLLLTAPDYILEYAPLLVHVRVHRSWQKQWQLQYALNDGVWLATDTAVDATYLRNRAWGVWCKYTKTRNKAFSFSNLSVVGDTCDLAESVPIDGLYITEILYDPFPTGVDFVELYNASDTVIDVGRCRLSNGKKQVKLPTYSLFPNTYVAITSSDSVLKAEYPNACYDRFLQEPSLPNFVNDSGWVYVWYDAMLLDSLHYADAMHHNQIHDAEGFSLERVPFDGNSWFSAASDVMATPGCENSQGSILPDTPDVLHDEVPFWLSKNWFSPREQYLQMYHQVEEGSIANAWVYNVQGVPVYRLYNNTLLAASGSTYWDGMDDEGYPCAVGIYIVVVEWQTLSGENRYIKLPVALGG